ncbi:MAG: alpha/beta fold hydrolase [Pseudomonadota bacterium]
MTGHLQVVRLVIACGLIATGIYTAQAEEQRVVIPSANGLELSGTLQWPSERNGAIPAVLLIQGSGPTDRDGNQPPHLTPQSLKLLASLLAKEGWASLRFDKRGMHANAASRPNQRKDWYQFFRWEAFVEDAKSAFQFLKADPRVNAATVSVMGHSEGGLVALELARRRQLKICSLVLLATPGRPPGQVLQDQLRLIMQQQGADRKTIGEILRRDAEIQASIIATGAIPNRIPTGLRPIYQEYLGPFLQAFFKLAPRKLAEGSSAPFLAVTGTSDTQVFSDRDGPPFMRAAYRRNDGSRHIAIAHMTHMLHDARSGQTKPPSLHPTLDNEVTSWLRRPPCGPNGGAR